MPPFRIWGCSRLWKMPCVMDSGAVSNRCEIELKARREAGQLELMVQDDGPGLRPVHRTPGGIGLQNTRARLRQLYGDAASLEISNRLPHGVKVTITLPFRLAGEGKLARERADRR